MRSNTDAILISKAKEGWHIFCSVTDHAQSGSVLDFVAHRLGAFTAKGVDLGRVRQYLRPWVGANPPKVSPTAYVSDLKPVHRDVVSVRARWSAFAPIIEGRHQFLNERGIMAETLSHDRFRHRIRDDRGTAIFPHFNRDGISAFERRNVGVTMQSKGGIRGLWFSATRSTDTALVLTEAPIDALAYCQIFNLADTARFASVSGQPSPVQLDLVRGAMEKMPSGAVIIATDNDAAGVRIASQQKQAFDAVNRADLTLRVHHPETPGSDWADMLPRPESLPPPPTPG